MSQVVHFLLVHFLLVHFLYATTCRCKKQSFSCAAGLILQSDVSSFNLSDAVWLLQNKRRQQSVTGYLHTWLFCSLTLIETLRPSADRGGRTKLWKILRGRGKKRSWEWNWHSYTIVKTRWALKGFSDNTDRHS